MPQAMAEEAPNLATLLPEMVWHLASFLGGSDLLRLRGTCRRLRAVLDDDTVWRRHLNPREHQILDSLAGVKQQVEPRLEFDVEAHPPCPNLVRYLQKARLLKNWRHFNFVEPTYASRVGHLLPLLDSTYKSKSAPVMYRDNYIFVAYNNEGFVSGADIHVFDVSGQPVLVATIFAQGISVTGMHVAGDHLIVAQHLVATVYHITLPNHQMPLVHSFAVTENTVTYGKRVSRPQGMRGQLFGQFFSGNLLVNVIDQVLHIWNAVEAIKVGSYTLPISINLRVTFNEWKDYWVLRSRLANRYENLFCFFDRREKQFAPFTCKFTGKLLTALFHDSSIILFSIKGVFMYGKTLCSAFFLDEASLRAAQDSPMKTQYLKIKESAFEERFKELDCYPILVQGNILVCERNHLLVLDPCTLNTLRVIYHIYGILHHFDIFGSLFVITRSEERRLMDIGRNTYRCLGTVYDAYIDISCTKIVLYKTPGVMRILHFW